MPLPDHLHPTTYWEKRCELLEDSVFQILRILSRAAVPPAAAGEIADHVRQWNDLLVRLGEEYPPSTTADSASHLEPIDTTSE